MKINRTEKMCRMLADANTVEDGWPILKRRLVIRLIGPGFRCPLCHRQFLKAKSWVIDPIPVGEPIRCKSCWHGKRGKILIEKWRKQNGTKP